MKSQIAVTHGSKLLAELRASLARRKDANHAAGVRDGFHGILDLANAHTFSTSSSQGCESGCTDLVESAFRAESRRARVCGAIVARVSGTRKSTARFMFAVPYLAQSVS